MLAKPLRRLLAVSSLAAAWLIASVAAAQTFSGRVLDEGGMPVGDARVSVNRAARTTTAADGTFTVDTARDPAGDQVVAAAAGLVISWIDLAPADPTTGLALTAAAIPADGATFRGSIVCRDCHASYERGWGAGRGGFGSSAHARDSLGPSVLDLWRGTASGRTDEASCTAGGGSWETVSGADGMPATRCYLGAGYLADVNPQCGHAGQRRCDDTGAPAESRPTTFGDCAGCHAPEAAIGLPAVLDLDLAAAAAAPAFDCAACHRVLDVLAPNAPGLLAGAVVTRVPDGSRYFATGPLDDVTNMTMRSSWSPLVTESRFCAACHQDTHRAAGAAARWPDGVPSRQTYEEWAESSYAMDPVRTCQTCHMPSLMDLGIVGASDRIGTGGPPREASVIHAHDFDAHIDPDALAAALTVTVEGHREGEAVVAEVAITNAGVGHAFPTGDTSRNALLLVTATVDRRFLVETGGDVLPGFAGSLASGTLEATAGATVTLDRDLPSRAGRLELRAWRETGEPRDYQGVGVFRALPPESKGVPRTEALGRWPILAVRGRELDLDESDLPVPDLTGARFAVGNDRLLAGTAGLGFAKVTVDGDGTENVPFWRATDLRSDNRLAPGETQRSSHRFTLPAGASGEAVLTVTLVYRRTMVERAEERGWSLEETDAIKVTRRVSLSTTPTPPDAGPPDAGSPDAASPDAGTADAAPADGGALDAAAPGDAGRPPERDAAGADTGRQDAGGGDSGPAAGGDDGGCGCHAGARSRSTAPTVLVLALLAVLALVRRRRS